MRVPSVGRAEVTVNDQLYVASQVSGANGMWLRLLLDFLSASGISDQEIIDAEITLPGNHTARAFRTSGGEWNWEIE